MRSFYCLLISLCGITASIAHGEPILHERIEWSDMWVTDAEKTTATRVLLVGDSIVRGYYAGVEEALGKDVSCARYTTSKFLSHPDYLAELGLMIQRFDFDVIHFNNGLHGWGYTEEAYAEGLETLVLFLRRNAPNAQLIWAMTTPVRVGKDIEKIHEERTPRAIARNAIATEIMTKHGIATNDLYRLVADRTDYFSQDGTHFNEAGKAAQATQVADEIQKALNRP